jgi:amidase
MMSMKPKKAPASPRFPSVSDSRKLLAQGKLSAAELLAEHLGTISARNPVLNALPTLCVERALDEAKALDQQLTAQRNKAAAGHARGVGPLAGMVYCAKDMHDTEGVRTTYGSPIFAHRIPKKDAEIVRRIRAAGALLVGKSNTPEFAAGAQTFNQVFGATRNPWDVSRTCGGSTGGGAVALASGMVMLADGSDLSASLRNPASFCGVVGLRPSSHLEPRLQTGLNPFNTLSMVGPMARTVADTRELFLAIFDPQGCQPDRTLMDWVTLRSRQAATRQQRIPDRGGRPLRLGWAPDWGGLPVQHEVAALLKNTRAQLESQGIELVEGFPGLPDYREAFMTLRGEYFVSELSELYQHHRSALKETVVWNIEQGMALTCSEIARAQKTRSITLARVERYMREHDLDGIAGATSQVLPFDLDTPFITEINGKSLDTYIDWVASNFWVAVAGLPAISIPAGLTTDSVGGSPLPVGLQIVGRWGEDMALLDTAEAIETLLNFSSQR